MVLVDEPGSGRLFVNDMWGLLYAISYDGSVTRYLDARESRWEIEVKTPERALIMEVGLQSFAFHPHFNEPGTAGYEEALHVDRHGRHGSGTRLRSRRGRRHTRHRPSSSGRHATRRPRTYDGGPPRELFRVEQPFGNHNGGRIGFNPTSSPGDPDFGLLYIGMADGGAAGDELDIAQNLGSVFGKILRVHPLGSNSANGRYGVPADNPYARDGVDRTLGEIYASGLRNPQGFDWDAATGDLLMADIGQSVVETLNVVPAGGDLGWNTLGGELPCGE